MTVNMDLSLRGRSTEEWSLVRCFNNPHSGRRHALLWGSHPCEAQCKICLDTKLCSSGCSGSTCSTLDLAGRLANFGCCAGLSLCLSTETLTALVKFGKQLCKTRCFRRRKGLCRVPLTVGTPLPTLCLGRLVASFRLRLWCCSLTGTKGSQTYCIGASSEASTPCFPKGYCTNNEHEDKHV